jgi:2',3'-cyclic-nucleotide 2'-phosphodiesterase
VSSAPLKILVIGDIVGKPGRRIVRDRVPRLRKEWGLDLVIANAENSAAGSGITHRIFRDLRGAGVDLLTMGDHSWRRKDNLEVFEKEDRLLRPLNYPDRAIGTGSYVIDLPGGERVGVVIVLGRVFMENVDCPFRTLDRALEAFPPEVKVKVVEFHAEATSEKMAAAWYLDGRVSCIFGTHTHVPTADDRILPKGTAYISDVGMTGPYDSVIGRRAEAVLHKFLTAMHAPFTVAEGNVHLCGALLEVDRDTGRAVGFRRVDLWETGAAPFEPTGPLREEAETAVATGDDEP